MAKQEKSVAEITYEQLVSMLMNYWKNIAINIFEWKGIPEEIPSELLSSEIIENWFFEEGKCVFIKDAKLGLLCLKVEKEGFNVVGKPTKYKAYGNGYIKTFSPEDCVFMKNTSTEMATRLPIEYYVQRIAEIEMTKALRLNTHKTPLALECDEKTELSAKNTFKKIRANEPVIYRNKNRGEGNIEINALNFDVSYINDKLNDEINTYEAKILTLLGLDNFVEDKAERVQSAEVDAHQEYIISAFRSMLEMRQKACEEINKKFGLNLSVEFVKGEQINSDEQSQETTEVQSNE